jgi:hypothetical protein
MSTNACPPRFILKVTFDCSVSEEERPAAAAVRIPRGVTTSPHIAICQDCYAEGVADGIIDLETGDFADF